MDSEVSGHSHLAPLLLGLWKAKNKTKQNKTKIMVEGHGGGKLLTSWNPGNREQLGENRVSMYPLKHTPGDLPSSNHTFPSTFYHLLITP
jgi:hypothetical protein